MMLEERGSSTRRKACVLRLADTPHCPPMRSSGWGRVQDGLHEVGASAEGEIEGERERERGREGEREG
jgi:hypothetical protein